MFRALSLFLAVAYLGVAALPCFEGGAAFTEVATVGGVSARVEHHPTVVASSAPASEHVEHDHSVHGMAAEDRGMHAPVASAERSGQHQEAPENTLAMKVPCLCGCDSSGSTPGTTSSPRLGFALFRAAWSPILEDLQADWIDAIHRAPNTPTESPDHVPISA